MQAGSLRKNLERAHGEIPDASGQSSPAQDRHGLPEGVDADAAGEEQIDRLRSPGGEDPGILEEERPLFGKEQRKPREVGALLIDLDLREIGVVREIECETGGYAVLDLAPELSAAPSLRVNRVVPFHSGEGVGRRRPHPAGGDLHALERAGTRDLHQAELAGNEGPEGFLVLAADRAHQVESPRLLLAGSMAQRRERDPELSVPAGRVDGRGDGPGAVPVQVEASERAGHRPGLARQLDAAAFAFVDDLRVVLDPRRRGGEDEAVLPIMIGIE